MQSDRSLLFVYNAGRETLTTVNDPLMKTAASGSERCSLHALTYSPVGMKKEWKRFLHDIAVPVRFLSRDEFLSEFPAIQTTFPAAFIKAGEEIFILVSTEEIGQCRQIEDLVGIVRDRVSRLSGAAG